MSNRSWRAYCWKVIPLALLVLAALGCNMPLGNRSTPTPTPTATSEVALGITPSPTLAGAVTAPPVSTPTSSLPPTPTQCTYDATFIDDVTIPDGTEIPAGQAFTKTWRLINDGCLNWPAGTALVYVRGEQMGGPASVPVPATSVGSTVDISVNLTAPTAPGSHRGYWQLQAPGGVRFGPQIYVEITVPAVTATPVPKPDLVITNVRIVPATPLDEILVTIYATVKNNGSAGASASTVGISVPGAGAPIPVPALAPGVAYEAQMGFTMDAGVYTLEIKADIDGVVDESDEGNNVYTQSLTVHAWRTFFTSSATVANNQCVDLDSGAMGACGAGSDFLWNATTGGGGIAQYALVPQNGAKFAVYGTSSPVNPTSCMAASLGGGNLDGGQFNVGSRLFTSFGNLPVGTYVCYQTEAGRYGVFRVNNRQPDFTLGFTTWQID